jgi:hypothetical protein
MGNELSGPPQEFPVSVAKDHNHVQRQPRVSGESCQQLIELPLPRVIEVFDSIQLE